MRVLVLLLVVLYTSNAIITLESEWEKFKREHNRHYLNTNEDNFRKAIFAKNLQEVKDHNERYRKRLETYTKTINEFSDYTDEENARYLYGNRIDLKLHKHSVRIPQRVTVKSGDLPVPDMVDWRLEGVVTPVKNQKSCGSCWAFAAIGALEAHHAIYRGSLVTFSEQQLIDCMQEDGCKGALAPDSYSYIIENGGINHEEDYPYRDASGECRYNASKPKATLRDFYLNTEVSEETLQSIVADYGPVLVQLDGDGIRSYRKGVFYNPSCAPNKTDLNHAAVVVGYGTEEGEDYWLVKNSWGARWGIEGYLKVARNRGNNCGMTYEVCYPIFD